MKIALATLGTRGDVQPYIAVGLALVARGHDVTLLCAEEFAPLVRSYGLAHRRMGPNFKELLQTDTGRAWLTSGESPRKYARYARELFLPMQRPACEEVDAALEGMDAVAFYAMVFGVLHAAERRKLPTVVLAPWPMVATRELAPVPTPWLNGAPGFVKKWAGDLVLEIAFKAFNSEHLAHRESVGLPPYRARDPFHAVFDAGTPSVHLFSEHVVPRPRDWDARHAVAGFAFAPPRAFTPPPRLEDFLSAGPPPIYLGFGSMTGFEPEQLAELATRAARLAGVRAVVASGWAGLDAKPSDDVFVLDEIPHDWLFPRVSAVVHHGGVGTFAEGLRAGKPTVIAAFFGDQPFWGSLNERLGTGPRALKRKTITAENLGRAIREAVENPRYRARAAEVAGLLAAEQGAARAAEIIERRFASSTIQR